MVIVNAKNAAMMIVTAESCTGGLVSGALTEIAGASDVFERGFVTYSNASKVEALGVPAEVIAAYGAVSAETARAMALGALERSAADISVSITGIAGPGGGSVEKPVGLVHFASARRGGAVVHIERRFGPLSRADIRAAAVDQALDMLLAAIGD
ncbi:CinA family protein [Methylocystis parvus]|uniref:CinA family protein n=2 Tax=Methylocystis parvus TaxID=134 RepID=A0A6B8MB16_9HYPH|nr:CinA family protein [Methylocystis parvus]QGM98779.1 CinA family protein [Methylocystis parvus]WBK00870.1 CinA family protein [Methylocystis parvus OBBP]